MTNVEALKNLYVAQGGQREDVEDLNTSADVINAMAGYVGLKDTGVQAEKGSATLFGKKVSAMQSMQLTKISTCMLRFRFLL